MRAEKLHSEVRREQIAEAAMTLIAAQGLKGLSVAAVARRVGLVPSALYRHFKGKEEILKATLELVRALLIHNVQSVRQASSSPLEQLRLLSLRHIGLIREFQAIPRIVFSDEITASYPFRRTAVYAIVQEFLGQVEDLVRDGQRQGQINPELKPETVAIFFLGLVQPPIILWYLSNKAFNAARHTERAWALFKDAIMQRDRQSRPSEGLSHKKAKTRKHPNT